MGPSPIERQAGNSWAASAVHPPGGGYSAGQWTSNPSCCASARIEYRERLKQSGMVDLLGMFRRGPIKRNSRGFARAQADITGSGDSMGELLTSPVRDAPPLARANPAQKQDLPRPERSLSSNQPIGAELAQRWRIARVIAIACPD